MNASCSGLNWPSGAASPSTVCTLAPSTITAGIRHADTTLPSTSTLHAPHTPMLHASLVPVSPSRSRSRSISRWCASTVTSCDWPFTSKRSVWVLMTTRTVPCSAMQQLRVVGTDAPRIEGREKVTGASVYTVDVKLPGMLWARILRSTVPHATLERVDASAARSVPGVQAVVTGADLNGLLTGVSVHDMPVLCTDR